MTLSCVRAPVMWGGETPQKHFQAKVSAAVSYMQELALDAVQSVTVEIPGGGREIDVKKYAKVHTNPRRPQ